MSEIEYIFSKEQLLFSIFKCMSKNVLNNNSIKKLMKRTY